MGWQHGKQTCAVEVARVPVSLRRQHVLPASPTSGHIQLTVAGVASCPARQNHDL